MANILSRRGQPLVGNQGNGREGIVDTIRTEYTLDGGTTRSGKNSRGNKKLNGRPISIYVSILKYNRKAPLAHKVDDIHTLRSFREINSSRPESEQEDISAPVPEMDAIPVAQSSPAQQACNLVFTEKKGGWQIILSEVISKRGPPYCTMVFQ